MNKPTTDLKNQYSTSIKIIIAINIMVFYSIYIYGEFNYEKVSTWLELFKSKNSLVALCIPLLATVLNHLLSTKTKEILVFWKIKYPLPGTRAFTSLINKDHRINKNKLLEKHGKFPQDPVAQNNLWYSIFQIHQNELIVLKSHGDYLFLRDFSSLSFIFVLIFGLPTFIISGFSQVSLIYFVVLLLQYGTTSISAKNAGNRFACNVLTKESQI